MAAKRLVLDASYALEALLPSSQQTRRETLHVLDAIAASDITAHVPWIFFAELAYVANKSVNGKRLDAASAGTFLAYVDALGLDVDPAEQGSLELFQTGQQWHCGAYDAAYLDLAARLAVPIATRDRGVKSAARTYGVSLFNVGAVKRP